MTGAGPDLASGPGPPVILVPLPDHSYYLWQAVVQQHWLIEHGWPVRYLVYCQRRPSRLLAGIMEALPDWHCRPDWRSDNTYYNAAMKPWMVGKHLSEHPGPALILDPDCLPLREWPEPVEGALLGTGTDSYTGHGYLRGRDAWEPLCGLVGVDPVEAARHVGIGAQYVTTQPGEWWQHVARLSVKAFKLLSDIPSPDEGYAVQAWCAEMYVTQLAAIRDGIEPVEHPDMGMVWATGKAADWQAHGFFHNAGLPAENGRDLCKVTYQRSPFRQSLTVAEDSATAPYVDRIRAVEADWPHIVDLF